MKSELERTPTDPASTPGNDTSCESGLPPKATSCELLRLPTASTKGRARICEPFEPTLKPWPELPRKKKSPSIPKRWQSSSHMPARIRKPLRKLSLSLSPPKSVEVPGAPRTPALPRGVPFGEVVTKAGVSWPLAIQ